MTRTEYDHTPGVNFSTLKHILRSPSHYHAALHAPREEEDEAKFAVGTLTHAMILEGKSLLDLYAVKPAGMSFATSAGKLWKATQTLPILKEEDANTVPRMAEAIANDKDASAILRACLTREHAVMGDFQGVACKSLLDSVGRDAGGMPVIADLKTTLDARHDAFAKKSLDLDYDMQAEFYSRLLQGPDGFTEKPSFVWIVVEKTAPFAVQCYYPSPEMWASGHRKVERALNLLQTCRSTNEWPAYPGGLKPLTPPRWAMKEGQA